jgi:RNA-directed DNA polymerase
MRKIGNLLPRIAALDNLYLAYWKAKRGKEHKPEVFAFGQNLKANLLALQTGLLSGALEIGDYHYFTIYDPKERLICASSFRERVLQHALMNICHDTFEKFQINDSYACRKGKGTYAALDKAKILSSKYLFFAKLDVRKYFETIDHRLLKQALARLFKDQALLAIFYQIIDSYENAPHQGIPIGNLSSQYFANHFLGIADHFIKEQLKAKAYLRYMDDMVIWANDLATLNALVKEFENFLRKKLLCPLKPSVINAIAKGLPFVGYVVYRHKVNLARRSRTRFRRKLKHLNALWAHQQITEAAYQRKILPLLAFVQKADSFLFQKKVILQQGK